MKILITGATGLIGSKITERCSAEGMSVNYLTTSRDKIVQQHGYRGYYWNPEKGEIDTECFEGVGAVINLAGANLAKRWTPSYKQTILKSRIQSLQTLHEGLQQYPHNTIHSLVSASAIGIYPNSLTEYYTEEEQEVDNSFLGEVTDAWEAEADKFGRIGISVAKVRIGLVLSEQGGVLKEMARPVRYYMGAAFGTGEQWQSWIHIEDLARIFLFLIRNKLFGVYNGVAPNPVTNNKLLRELAELLNKPLMLPNIPKNVLRLILGEMSYMLLASQRVSSRKIEEAGFEFSHLNAYRAMEDLLGRPGYSREPAPSSSSEYSAS